MLTFRKKERRKKRRVQRGDKDEITNRIGKDDVKKGIPGYDPTCLEFLSNGKRQWYSRNRRDTCPNLN